MASIELSPLAAHLDEGDIESLESHLAEAGSSPLDLDEDADTLVVSSDIDDALMGEFVDRLEVHDAACDVYVPPDFEERFEVGGLRIGSAHMLLMVLEELRDDLHLEEEKEEEEDEPGKAAAKEEEEEEEDFEDEEYEEDEEDEPVDLESTYEMKDSELRHIWKLMHRGARTCIRRGVCLFIRR